MAFKQTVSGLQCMSRRAYSLDRTVQTLGQNLMDSVAFHMSIQFQTSWGIWMVMPIFANGWNDLPSQCLGNVVCLEMKWCRLFAAGHIKNEFFLLRKVDSLRWLIHSKQLKLWTLLQFFPSQMLYLMTFASFQKVLHGNNSWIHHEPLALKKWYTISNWRENRLQLHRQALCCKTCRFDADGWFHRACSHVWE